MSYLPGRCRRSHLQLLSLTAPPSTAPSSPTAAFKQTSQNRLRRLTPPQRLYRPWGCIVSLEAQGDGASTEPYSSFSRSLLMELSAKRWAGSGPQKGLGKPGYVPRLSTPLFRGPFRGKFRGVPRLFRAPIARETSGTGAQRPFRACSATRGARSAVPPEPLVPRPAEQTDYFIAESRYGRST